MKDIPRPRNNDAKESEAPAGINNLRLGDLTSFIQLSKQLGNHQSANALAQEISNQLLLKVKATDIFTGAPRGSAQMSTTIELLDDGTLDNSSAEVDSFQGVLQQHQERNLKDDVDYD